VAVAVLLQRSGGFLPAVIALTLPLVFLPSAADTYILPRASLVLGGACLGVGICLLIPRSPGLGNLLLPLAAAAAAALLAFVFSVSWPLSLAGSYTRYESLPMRLAYLGLFASAAVLIRTKLQRDAVAPAFVFGVSVASLEGIEQAFAHVAFRPDGNLGNANLLAGLIAMGIPLAIDRARRATLFVGPWAASVVVMGAGLVVTTSRSGGLGAIAGTLVVVTLAVPRRLTVQMGVASILGLLAAAGFVLLSPLRALNGDPAALRIGLWQDGLRLLAARPFTGWGEDATGLTFGRFLTHDYAGLVTFDRVHSGPLDVAVTQGLLGLAALTWLLVLVARRGWARRDQADVAGLMGALAGFSVWVLLNFDWAPATGAFWLLAGVLVSSPLAADDGVGVRIALWKPAVSVALALAAIPLAVLPLLSDSWYLHGRADLAVRFDPVQAQYHWALGTIPELRRAWDLGETDPGMYVQLGDLERDRGEITAARAAYRRALEIDPYYSPATERLAALDA
jgi:O-antigen ligase